MKYIYVLIIMVLVGCSDDDGITLWIAKHDKPIIALKSEVKDGNYHHRYTLLSADGSIYASGWTYVELPDTIKSIYCNTPIRCVTDTVYLPAPCDSVGRVYIEFTGDTTGFSKIKGQSVHFRTVLK